MQIRHTLPVRYAAMGALSLLAFLVVAGFAPRRAAAQPVVGQVHSNRPSAIFLTHNTWTVTMSLHRLRIFPAGYSATATPPFGVGPNDTFTNPLFFGGFATVSSQWQNPTAAFGAPVNATLRGNVSTIPFANPSIAAKTFTSKWSTNFTSTHNAGVIMGTGGGGTGGGGGWHYINGEWVYIEGGGGPVQEVSVTVGIPLEPDPDDGFLQGRQSMRGTGYRFDSVAQASIAAFFGSSEVTFDMVRSLGPEIGNMGFAGQIDVVQLAQTQVDPGESARVLFSSGPPNASDLFMTQAISQFVNPTPNMFSEPVEYWGSFLGESLIPEPSSAATLALATATAAAMRRRRRALTR